MVLRMMMACVHCGAGMSAGEKFCGECGKPPPAVVEGPEAVEQYEKILRKYASDGVLEEWEGTELAQHRATLGITEETHHRLTAKFSPLREMLPVSLEIDEASLTGFVTGGQGVVRARVKNGGTLALHMVLARHAVSGNLEISEHPVKVLPPGRAHEFAMVVQLERPGQYLLETVVRVQDHRDNAQYYRAKPHAFQVGERGAATPQNISVNIDASRSAAIIEGLGNLGAPRPSSAGALHEVRWSDVGLSLISPDDWHEWERVHSAGARNKAQQQEVEQATQQAQAAVELATARAHAQEAEHAAQQALAAAELAKARALAEAEAKARVEAEARALRESQARASAEIVERERGRQEGEERARREAVLRSAAVAATQPPVKAGWQRVPAAIGSIVGMSARDIVVIGSIVAVALPVLSCLLFGGSSKRERSAAAARAVIQVPATLLGEYTRDGNIVSITPQGMQWRDGDGSDDISFDWSGFQATNATTWSFKTPVFDEDVSGTITRTEARGPIIIGVRDGGGTRLTDFIGIWAPRAAIAPAPTTPAPAAVQAPAAPIAPAPAAAGGGSLRVEVTVAETKANGAHWDIFDGLPDIAVCLTAGGSRRCEPGGRPSVPAGERVPCQDASTCTATFALDAVPSEVTVEVIDIDASSNDLIGTGTCRTNGRSCSVGQATVILQGPPPGPAAPVVGGVAETPEWLRGTWKLGRTSTRWSNGYSCDYTIRVATSSVSVAGAAARGQQSMSTAQTYCQERGSNAALGTRSLSQGALTGEIFVWNASPVSADAIEYGQDPFPSWRCRFERLEAELMVSECGALDGTWSR